MKIKLFLSIIILLLTSSSVFPENTEKSGGTAVLYADFSCGNEEAQEPEQIRTYRVKSESRPSAQFLARELSKLTGLDFFISSTEIRGGIVVDWSPKSTLLAGLDDRQQKEAFHFFDVESLNWFMMDSLRRTLKANLKIEEVYYTMDGGKTLRLPSMSSTQEFPPEIPYMGSPFYRNHGNVRGE